MVQTETGAAPRAGVGAAAPDGAFLERSLARARRLMSAGRHAEAAGSLSRLRSAPGAVGRMARGLRAEALLHLGRTEEAEAEAGAALGAGLHGAGPDEAGHEPELLKLRARIRLARGDTAGAADDAAAAVMQAPSDPPAMGLLGAALLARGELLEATYFFGRALQLCPEDPSYSLWLGRAFLEGGKHDAADEVLRFCSGLAPRAAEPWELRARNALEAGDAARAASIAGEAIRAGFGAGFAGAAMHSLRGHALRRQGLVGEAGAAFAEAARLAPADDYLAHLAGAVSGRGADRAGDGYVSRVFDGYAPRFEPHLLSLGYRVPALVLRLAQGHLRARGQNPGCDKLGPVLDLGCGTGLVGLFLSDLIGGRLVGVDLSSEMLSLADAKGLYTELRHEEITAALARDDAEYDLIAAADVFIYFGALDGVLGLCAARLAPGGCLVFSVEADSAGFGGEDGPGWRLQDNGRYAHGRTYIEAALARAGLEASVFRGEVVRREGDEPVAGHLVSAGKRGT